MEVMRPSPWPSVGCYPREEETARSVQGSPQTLSPASVWLCLCEGERGHSIRRQLLSAGLSSCHSSRGGAGVTSDLSSCPGGRPALENNLLALSFGFSVTHSTKLGAIFSRWHPSGESSACGSKCPGQVVGGHCSLIGGRRRLKPPLEIAVASEHRPTKRSLRLSFLFWVWGRTRQACD